MTTRPTHAVLSAVTDASDLIDAARTLAKTAARNAMPETAKQLRTIARDLDGWRTRLVQDGEDDLDAAVSATLDAAESLVGHAAHVGRGTRR